MVAHWSVIIMGYIISVWNVGLFLDLWLIGMYYLSVRTVNMYLENSYIITYHCCVSLYMLLYIICYIWWLVHILYISLMDGQKKLHVCIFICVELGCFYCSTIHIFSFNFVKSIMPGGTDQWCLVWLWNSMWGRVLYSNYLKFQI